MLIVFIVQGREPDVTHRTSWLDSTGECVWQPKADDQLPQRKGKSKQKRKSTESAIMQSQPMDCMHILSKPKTN